MKQGAGFNIEVYEIKVDFFDIPVDFERFIIIVNGLFRLAHFPAHAGEIGHGDRVIGIQPYGALEHLL